MMEEYGKKYKTAVEQIELSGEDKQELLEAVRGQKGVARKRRKIPFYLGGAVAAAAVMLIVAGNSHMFFSGSRKGETKNEGVENDRLYDHTQNDMAYMQEEFEAGEAASEDSEGIAINNSSESMNTADGYKELAEEEKAPAEGYASDNMKTDDSFFYIIAYDEGIELMDEDGAGSSSEKNAGNKHAGQESFAANSARVLEPGKSYGAYSLEAPSCNIAMFADDGGACDSYRIRVAGGVVKLVTGEETKELEVKDGERVCIQATDEFLDKDGMRDDKGTYAGIDGMEEDVWQDEGIITVTQVLIEAVKDHKVAGTRKIYVGQRGERYYGMVQ